MAGARELMPHRLPPYFHGRVMLSVEDITVLYFALYENRSLLSLVEFSKTTIFITTAG